ncbi:methyltransferase family protein [Hydrogenispora ethanolica]|jgi:ubiquinone/menaquinone biosynthesis C-methylase UbiE|uniref:Methyltransferase family protein n=1 Tax=Hydrogenispora ethanolica TaxID=1082276 RepID=A0A4V2QDK1_HYDET|nr:class I SAM-dependent methyltransferase [Hydrogenispora ethanolica]TCL64737.1 methyltransferase family protein [Hydrogenispora ethanolica]
MDKLVNKTLWHKQYEQMKIEELVKLAKQPQEFQLALRDIIKSVKKSSNPSKIIEIGCGNGITSLILDNNFEKYLLDYDPKAIELAKELFNLFNQQAQFFTSDMFDMPFVDEYFDIVFNAGVIEHFSFEDRVSALNEYSRVLKENGLLVIAFPNHYSLPYRLGYLKKVISGKWPYPQEFKLFDLKQELDSCSLELVKRVVTSKKTSFYFLSRGLRSIFLSIDKFFKFEGYLTVLIIKKVHL